ncbi:MAG TPA: hypothetical protein VHC94_09495 [Nitrobacter sp.]|nr:hypothetical protein [Nitrobacter sp.]
MNVKKLLGLAAVGAFLIAVSPAERAQAAPVNPGVAATVQGGAARMTTEVRWRHHHYWHRHWHPRRHWHPHYWHRRHWHR